MNAHDYLPGLARISLQAGVLVLLVLLAQGIFRRHLTARWHCALWLLVIVRLLLPFSPGSAASIFNLLPPWINHASPSAPTTLVPATVTPAAPLAVGKPMPETPVLVTQSAPPSESAPALTPTPELGQASLSPPKTSAAPTAVKLPPVTATSWLATLFWVWLAGALLLTGYIATSSLRLAWRCRGLPALTDASALAVLDESARRLGVRGRLTVVECAEVASPALFGLFRPRLLLPHGFTQSFSTQELRFVFLHELAHLRRWDLPLNWLVAVLQILHWFNPLVWFGFARWRLDRELACDALAIEAAGADQHREYGRTILHLLENLTPHTAMPGLVGILENKHQLRRRIGMIASYAPARRWSLPAILVVFVLAVVGLTDALESEQAKPAAKPATALAVISQRPVVTNGPSMKVTVLDADTGLPVSGAEVLAPNQIAFWGQGRENAPRWLTDEHGVAMIRLGEVPPETMQQNTWFTLSVRRTGYAPRGASWAVEKTDARLAMPGEFSVRLERGRTIGGVARDQAGVPQAGVRVAVFGTGYGWSGARVPHTVYPEYWSGFTDSSEIVTDSAGRWQAIDVPRDLDNFTFDLTRPNSPAQRYSSAPSEVPNRPHAEAVALTDLLATNAIFVLKSGFTVSGIVLDPQGRPLPDTQVKEGHGAVNLARDGEFRTDAAGRFVLRDRPRRQMILTAYAPGFAITSAIVDIGDQTPEARLQVAPLNPLHIRVVDGEGRAVAGAGLGLLGHKTEGQVLDFSGTTDADGNYVWTNAPLAELALTANHPKSSATSKYGITQMIHLTPTNRQATFRLRQGMDKELIVQAKVRDTVTDKPVVVKSVSFQTGDREGLKTFSEPNSAEFQLKISAAQFRQGMWPAYQLRLDADGYESLTLAWRDFVEGDWNANFTMQQGRSGGTVLLSDGKPAAGAKIAVPAREHLPMYLYLPGKAPRDWANVVRADESGHFEITYPGGDFATLIIHDDGFLETTANQLKGQPRLTLRPWGRVEGVLRAGTNVLPRVNVSLVGGKAASTGWHFNYNADTDTEGRFVFEKVPPGDCTLNRYFIRESGRPMTASYQQSVAVKAGDVTRVEYGGTGRPIIGRVNGDADWNNDDHLLVPKVPAERPQPRIEDFATLAAFEKARDAYSVEVSPRQPRGVVYQLRFEPDGSFRVDDVPTGIYELRIRITAPRKKGEGFDYFQQRPEIGSLVREVVMPEIPGGRSDQPLDLGTLELDWKQRPIAQPKPNANFKARTLDGKPFDLTQSRGKLVLLTFWTTWSERCTEQLGEFQKLKREYGPGARLEILGVSLDDDLEATRKAVKTRGYDWPQTWLEGESRAKVTAEFGVDILPATFLIDPEGHIVGRELEGERLHAAVRRALPKQ